MIFPDIPITQLLSFIAEDAPFGDITSSMIIDRQECHAVIIARNPVILAGLAETTKICDHLGIRLSTDATDGDPINGGSAIIDLYGDAHTILLIERTVLNLLGRMSGIATKTYAIQALVSAVNPDCRITATRKTAPGLRLIDKKAAIIGGADPHRFSLSDAVQIKDNHRALIPLSEAIKRAKTASIYHIIEAEVESPEEAYEAATAGADILLFDNMTPVQVQKTLDTLIQAGLREKILVEVSGKISEETIQSYAKLKVDRISLGMLTHTVKNADFSLDILPPT